jgi:histidine ammonia-lyase
VRARVSHLASDRDSGPDIAAATEMVRDGSLADLVESA